MALPRLRRRPRSALCHELPGGDDGLVKRGAGLELAGETNPAGRGKVSGTPGPYVWLHEPERPSC